MDHTVLDLNICKSYPGFELNVKASLSSGVTAIFGPSGSGKTTILDCISGLSNPDEGDIELNKRPLVSTQRGIYLRPEQRRVGYMFQDGLLFPHLRVKDNISYGYKRTPLEHRRVHPDQLVEVLDLGPLMDRKPANLSSGERQRVALARALATSPELLLMDEPLSALDMGLRGRILRYLKAIHKDLAIPMVYVSHAISEVMAIADTALVISHGRQLAFDQPHRVLLEPFVHSLVGLGDLENLLDVEVVDRLSGNNLTAARTGETVLWLTGAPESSGSGNILSIAIRAADIIIAVDRPTRISARNILLGRIQGLHQMDGSVLVYVDVGTLLMVEITPEALTNLELHEGQDIYLVIKSSSIMVLD